MPFGLGTIRTVPTLIAKSTARDDYCDGERLSGRGDQTLQQGLGPSGSYNCSGNHLEMSGEVLPLIRHAQLILDRRLAEINPPQSGCCDEALDLRASRTYLGILLQCMGSEAGELLWD